MPRFLPKEIVFQALCLKGKVPKCPLFSPIHAKTSPLCPAISYFFAIAQVVGSMGPLIFANFVGNGTDRVPLFWGYVLGSGVMIFGGVVAWFFGVDAEGKGLEDIAAPLTSVKPAVA